jgi:class 3 adenylate cyclase/tetratricopeptide (TPR) repeat protein
METPVPRHRVCVHASTMSGMHEGHGTRTLVFSDVEGSAQLWRLAPEVMKAAIEMHDRLLRELLVEHGGRELRGVGDAFLSTWEDPSAAIRWCLLVQEGLLAVDWPPALLELRGMNEVIGPGGGVLFRGLRVRMGAHLDHQGLERPATEVVRRAARVAGAARGGQVLISGSLLRILEGSKVLANHAVTDLGLRRLRGIAGHERLTQVLPRALAARRFAVPDTVDERKTNLVPEVTRFFGREPDVSAIAELFALGTRFVTVVGPSGIGKTRLASHVAARWVSDFKRQGGVWRADLSAVRSQAGLARAVATAIDIPLTMGRTIQDALSQLGFALSNRGPTLLVLDGLDYPPAASPLPQWLRGAPDLRILVTSIERVGVKGEIAYQLSGLGDGGAGKTAVELLVDRAPRDRPDLRTTGSASAAAASAAYLLKGIPLALELVGAQPAAQTWQDLSRELDEWFQATGRPRRPEEVVESVVAWVWEHLSLWEREVVAQLAVFRGGFDLSVAEKILDLTAFPAAPWVSDILATLCQRCILEDITLSDTPGDPRYRMPRVIRELVKMRLPRGRRSAAEDRHAAAYLSRAERWAEAAVGPEALEALSSLERERDNLLAVHRRGLHRGGPRGITWALRAALVLDPLLRWRGPADGQVLLFDQALGALDASGEVVSVAIVSRALRARASTRSRLGRTHEATSDLERALELAEQAGDASLEAWVHISMADHLRQLRRHERAQTSAWRASAIAVEVGQARLSAAALGQLGAVALATSDLGAATERLAEAIEYAVAGGDRIVEGRSVGQLGLVARRRGNWEQTEILYRRAIEIHRQTGDRSSEGVWLGNLGVLLLHQGAVIEAQETLESAHRLAELVGNLRSAAIAQTNLGLAALLSGDRGAAGDLFERAKQLHEEQGALAGQALCEGMLGVLDHQSGALGVAAERYQGAAMLADASGDARWRALVRMWWSVLAAETGDGAASDALWTDAMTALAETRDATLMSAADVLALARAHVMDRQVEDIAERLRTLESRGLDAEVAGRWLRARISRDA